jgi:hypothetical protein
VTTICLKFIFSPNRPCNPGERSLVKTRLMQEIYQLGFSGVLTRPLQEWIVRNEQLQSLAEVNDEQKM